MQDLRHLALEPVELGIESNQSERTKKAPEEMTSRLEEELERIQKSMTTALENLGEADKMVHVCKNQALKRSRGKVVFTKTAPAG